MTISDAIKAKLRRAMIIGFVFWLAFAATIIVLRDSGMSFLALIPFVGFGGTVLYVLFFIKCPRCLAPLGQVATTSRAPFSGKTRLNFCPNCGVNLNEPA